MQGSKALALEAHCKENQIAFTRFDYSGHGDSEGEFINGDIGSWLSDALCIFDEVATIIESQQKIIVVGSSMGAWIATLLSLSRKPKVAALLTIAAAPDFTEKLLLPALSDQQRAQLGNGKVLHLPTEYDEGTPYPISSRLIDHSRQHCVLGKQLDLNIPVRLLHGTNDTDVPYAMSVELMHSLQSTDCQLVLIKDADHRLSSDNDLATLISTLQSLITRTT